MCCEHAKKLMVNCVALPGFMGYALEIYALISHHPVKDTDDDQLYYTQLYLDEKLRVSWILVYTINLNVIISFQSDLNMRLDHRAHIFQNLNGAKDEVRLEVESNGTSLLNSIYDTKAAVYHGNGPSKVGAHLTMMQNFAC